MGIRKIRNEQTRLTLTFPVLQVMNKVMQVWKGTINDGRFSLTDLYYIVRNNV
ncbi:MAG: hypothetical protein JHC41_01565 [Nitrosopumilus sp.]|nr:hypothetical protein [Nitrosopumilus sp.]